MLDPTIRYFYTLDEGSFLLGDDAEVVFRMPFWPDGDHVSEISRPAAPTR